MKNKGFTIVEILIVLVIIGVLATSAQAAWHKYQWWSKNKQAMIDLRLLEQAITVFYYEEGTYPLELDQVRNRNMLHIPKLDPWGNPYQYFNLYAQPPGWPKARRDRNDKPLNHSYDLYSMGADGRTMKQVYVSWGADDIIRADDGAFVNLAREYRDTSNGPAATNTGKAIGKK